MIFAETFEFLKSLGPLDVDIVKAFESPDLYDWQGVPNHIELAILQAIETGHSFLFTYTPLWDRKQIHEIVNANRRESIEIKVAPGGWALKRV